MKQGIANPGVRYNRARDIQIEYLLDFALRFKELAVGRRADLLMSPWQLR
jgi:5-methylcytosine-specific restriction enzyme B